MPLKTTVFFTVTDQSPFKLHNASGSAGPAEGAAAADRSNRAVALGRGTAITLAAAAAAAAAAAGLSTGIAGTAQPRRIRPTTEIKIDPVVAIAGGSSIQYIVVDIINIIASTGIFGCTPLALPRRAGARAPRRALTVSYTYSEI